VLIPFVIPWEQSAALQTQTGMGAFGQPRDAHIRIDQGNKLLTQVSRLTNRFIFQGAVHSESVLTMFSESNKFASQSGGEIAFGAHRKNVSKVIDNHDFDDSKVSIY
jgi:hypothetical protein